MCRMFACVKLVLGTFYLVYLHPELTRRVSSLFAIFSLYIPGTGCPFYPKEKSSSAFADAAGF